MSETQAQAPKNELVLIVNLVLDVLIKGLGADAAIAAAISSQPWLGLPVISSIFKWGVGLLASQLDSVIKDNLDIIIIGMQNDSRKQDYDEAIARLKNKLSQGVTVNEKDQAVTDARNAINNIVHRTR